PAERLRVLLADPPIDWSSIRDRAAWERVAATRDRHAADLVERESIARGRQALLIFGSGHIEHEAAVDGVKTGRKRSPNLAELLQSRHPGALFLILADWMTP